MYKLSIKLITTIFLAVSIMLPASIKIFALEAGELEILSQKGQSFEARIAISSNIPLEENVIYAAIPTDEDLRQLNIRPQAYYNTFNTTFIRDSNNHRRGYIILKNRSDILRSGRLVLPIYIENGKNDFITRIYNFSDKQIITQNKENEKPKNINQLSINNNPAPVKQRRQRDIFLPQVAPINTNIPSMDIVSGDNLENVGIAIKNAQHRYNNRISKEQIMYIIKANNPNLFRSRSSLDFSSNVRSVDIPNEQAIISIDRNVAVNYISQLRNSNRRILNPQPRQRTDIPSRTAPEFQRIDIAESQNQLSIINENQKLANQQELQNAIVLLEEQKEKLYSQKEIITNNLNTIRTSIAELKGLIELQKQALDLDDSSTSNNLSSENIVNEIIEILTEKDPLLVILFVIFIILLISIIFSILFNVKKKIA